jgi:hypothetical protein
LYSPRDKRLINQWDRSKALRNAINAPAERELRNALKKKNTVCKSESATAISVACCQITLNE